MIISASRRTDIPACYSKWFFNRLKAGYCMARNPFNPNQVKRVDLTPNTVDGFVFWTKDPAPMIPHLDKLAAYNYYFTFTLTPYGTEIEPGLRDKGCLLQTFRVLSKLIGAERVIWRYDPIILTEKYSMEFHIDKFKLMAEELSGYTRKCVISFVDSYLSIKKQLSGIGAREITEGEIHAVADSLAKYAAKNKMEIASCCETIDLSCYGITHNKCIDAGLMSRIAGWDIESKKDRYQRDGCGCDASVDIGAYDTCGKGCLYCYAVHSKRKLEKNLKTHDQESEFLDNK